MSGAKQKPPTNRNVDALNTSFVVLNSRTICGIRNDGLDDANAVASVIRLPSAVRYMRYTNGMLIACSGSLYPSQRTMMRPCSSTCGACVLPASASAISRAMRAASSSPSSSSSSAPPCFSRSAPAAAAPDGPADARAVWSLSSSTTWMPCALGSFSAPRTASCEYGPLTSSALVILTLPSRPGAGFGPARPNSDDDTEPRFPPTATGACECGALGRCCAFGTLASAPAPMCAPLAAGALLAGAPAAGAPLANATPVAGRLPDSDMLVIGGAPVVGPVLMVGAVPYAYA